MAIKQAASSGRYPELASASSPSRSRSLSSHPAIGDLRVRDLSTGVLSFPGVPPSPGAPLSPGQEYEELRVASTAYIDGLQEEIRRLATELAAAKKRDQEACEPAAPTTPKAMCAFPWDT
ncbi:hypothetical protein VD0004_g5301 [Verticillium dahliae]|nr:hypothetical protein VD0004_g5301 [Verticillium dahliae]